MKIGTKHFDTDRENLSQDVKEADRVHIIVSYLTVSTFSVDCE